MKKVLIIKLGYSETLDSMLSLTPSLGDVLRTTVILHFFKNSHISWLVDIRARPLLENNKRINRILDYNDTSKEMLTKERFDVIINLEKLLEVCLFSQSILAKKYFGFTVEGFRNSQDAGGVDSEKLIRIIQDLSAKRENRENWEGILVRALGWKWQGEGYILGYEPRLEVKYDIGFNWTIGPKWSNKAWPRACWEKLERLIDGEYSVSWQEGMDSIHKYIEWISSCKLIVTADTLGLHIALALKKRIIALFGPTSCYEIRFHGCGSFLLPEAPYDCIPCFKARCDKEKQCMEFISPEKVKEKIDAEFKEDNFTAKV